MTKIVTDNSGVLSNLLKERSKLIQENAKLTLENKELNEQLILYSVGQQRELLYALADELDVATGKLTPPSVKTLVINKILGI